MSGGPPPSQAIPGGDGRGGKLASSSMTHDVHRTTEMPPPPRAPPAFNANQALRNAEQEARGQRPDLFRPTAAAGSGGSTSNPNGERRHRNYHQALWGRKSQPKHGEGSRDPHRKRPWEAPPGKKRAKGPNETSDPLFVIDREGGGSAGNAGRAGSVHVKEEAKPCAALMPPPPPKRLKSCLKNASGPSQQQHAAASQPPGAKSSQTGTTPATKEAGNHVAESMKEETGSEQCIIDLTADPDRTHAIFAIDFSRSMREQDVEASGGKKITRWEAVFECIDSFLAQQLQQARSGAMSVCFVSVLLFNTESQVVLKRMPLTGDGSQIRHILRKAKKKHNPHGGTGFAAGLKQAAQLAQPIADDKVVLVFLSDGRPGDLHHPPPHHPTVPMQTTFKFNKKTFPAAGHYIETMQRRHTDFSLQLICLYDDGKKWLKYLAGRYNGTFHHPDLALDDAPAASKPCPPKHASKYEEDGEVEVMHVKSQATLLRERSQRAKAAGEVVSLTQTQSTNASSIRSTFSSISATVTAMRSGPKLQERAVIIQPISAMITFQATRMVLASGGDKFVVAPGETANERRVSVSMHPFAQGGLRNVYSMKQRALFQERRQVAKESRHDIAYNERLRFHLETVKCQARASMYVNSFNKQVKRARKWSDSFDQELAGFPGVNVLSAEVYRLIAPTCPGGYRYLAVEENLDGSYEKYNNNDGFVNLSDCMKCKTAQAFSHFTYEKSDRQEMVVDIQGCGFTYTDPQLHSVQKEFGRADRGTVGIDKFFATHKCNFICRELGLTARKGA